MRRGWVSGAVVAVLVAGVAVAARFATLDLRTVEQEPVGIETRPPLEVGGGIDASRGASDGPDVLGPVVLVLLLLLLLVVAGWAGWTLLRRLRGVRIHRADWYRLRALGRPTTGPAPGSVGSDQLLAAIDEAVARSEDDPDPRRAVIACWVRLAEAAAAAGAGRHESDTATDLVVRMLRGHQVSEPVLAAFAEAYWLARYATHTVDETMRTQARSALRRLRAELAGEVSVA
jgi:Domain of unknown function (DUF4129)